jgi:hypothetical protein
MYRPGGLIAIALALTACASMLSGCTSLPEPTAAEQYAADYTKLAACYYEAERSQAMTGLKFTDLRATNTAIVSREMSDMYAGNVPLSEVRFVKAGENRSTAEIRVFASIWGKDIDRAPILAKIKTCI